MHATHRHVTPEECFRAAQATQEHSWNLPKRSREPYAYWSSRLMQAGHAMQLNPMDDACMEEASDTFAEWQGWQGGRF